MATTKKEYTASSGQTAYNDHGIEFLNNLDIEVWITDTDADYGAGVPVLQTRGASAASAIGGSHEQVLGTRLPSLGSSVKQRGYTISTDGTDITLTAAPTTGSTVTVQRVTRDGSGNYTSFASGSTIRHTDLNQAFNEVRYQAQEAKNGIMGGAAGQAAGSNIDAAQLIGTLPAIDGSNLTGITVASGAVTSASIVDGAIVNADINASAAIGLAKLATGALPSGITVASTNIVDGTIVAGDLASDSVTTAKVEDGAITAAKIATGALDGRYYTETEADARFYNLASAEEIQSGETWSAGDDKVATTAAIDARIIDLVDDVGGFVPIASENHFPTTNPDVNNGTGTLVSIKALSENIVTGSGVTSNNSIAQTTGGTAVNITGLTESTTYAAGFGMIVETTTTLNEYSFHRLTPKATEVTTVAGNISNINTVASANSNITTVAGANSNISAVATDITNVNNVGSSISNVNSVASNLSTVNDFAARYRVASSAPGSDNDEGDLYFNTTSNELQVYNGSAWQGGVTATGNLLSTGGGTMTGDLVMDNQADVRFEEATANGSNYIALQAPASIASNVTLTLPAADGSSGQTLTTDGSGTLSWASGGSDKMPLAGGTFTGDVTLNAQKDLRFGDSDSSHYVALQAPATVASNLTLTLPAADGSANQVLKTDGSGALGWADQASGATGGSTDEVFVENARTVTASYTITSTKNAHTVGPISLNSGAVITVPENSTWYVH